MFVYSGPDASVEFQQRLKSMKNDRLYWCAVTIEWNGKELPRWVEDTTVMMLLEERLLKTLANEHEKVFVLALQSGDIIVAGETLTNAAYQRVKTTLQSFVAELEVQTHALCQSYDLSVSWDQFMAACRTIYNRINVMNEHERTHGRNELIQRLNNELSAASGLIGKRASKPSSLNLLFVEDEPTIRQLLNNLLGDSGHNLFFAENGEEAVHIYASKPPHIVFLDINLPDISGLKLLELIARYDPGAHPVMLTSGAAQEQVRTAVEQGVKGYIVKPFSRRKLTDCIQRYYSF